MNVPLVQAVCRAVRVNPNESMSVCGGNWFEIDGAEKATCLAFNPWGTLLSVGEKDGLVILWDFSSIPNIIRELNPKLGPSALVVPDIKQVTSCAWSPNGRVLAVACELKAPGRKGALLLWDVESSTLMAAIACESMATHVAFPPRSIVGNAHGTSVLASCGNGDLQRITWATPPADPVVDDDDDRSPSLTTPCTLYYHADRFRHLHFHVHTIDTLPIFASICGGDASIPQSTRNFSPLVVAKFGSDRLFAVSLKGAVAMLDPHTFELLSGHVLPPISSVDLFVDATALLVPSSKGIHEICHYDGASMAETRLFTAGAAVRAPWIMASKSPDGKYVLGLPQPRGIYVGEKGMYMWDMADERMHHDHRFAGDMVAVAWHPRRESLTVISTAGSVHVLEVQYASSWPGAMYPPGFTLITDNVVYEEPEDEFDVNVKAPPPMDDASMVVDILTIERADDGMQNIPDEDDNDDDMVDPLQYLPASPLTTWNHEAVAFEDDDVSSIFSTMKARPPTASTAPASASKSKKRKSSGK
ncbi:Aste57867_8913 [Aphanomyces stellatus]|uniref:Aste57867_8913 protein n=1 Tax=Aphanomyces stellatus TaxID=120398 RepID=A0A485KLH2_9STRA|nr:hypothetical protein As57867_008878 [Aphanomyces stellatus]VFT85797.1 Aste57867_8913 [Aphanomyces stellatus]